MRFKLYRPKHLRIESNGLVQNLRNLLNKPKALVAGVALIGAISAFSPAKAMAAENQIGDTATPVTQEQVVESEVTQSNDTVAQAVEQSQAVTTPAVTAPVQEVSTPAPSVSEPVQQAAPVQEVSVPVSEPVQQAAPVQETSVPVSEPVQEQVAPVQEEATPSINEEIDSRVPQVDTQVTETASEVTSTENSSDINTDVSQTETEVADEVKDEQVADVTSSEATTEEDTKEEISNNQQSDEMEIVTDNQVATDQAMPSEGADQMSDIKENVTTEVSSSEKNEEKEETAEVTSTEIEVNENTNANYHVISQDGNLTIVGNISEDQLSQVIEDLTNQYGEEAVNGLTVFDYDTINSQVDYGETVQLANSGYTAIKHEDGSIEIKDIDGNVIASWQGQEKDIEDKQEITVNEGQEVDQMQNVDQNQNEEGPTISEDLTIPEDYVSKDYEVSANEYLVIENADGSYTIAMGGVGLSGNQLQDLISKLQADGVIPADAQVTPGVLPSAPTDEMKEQGKTEQSAQVGDYIISTTDGINYTIYSEDGTALDTVIKYEDQHLEDNYETSKDPDAVPGDKPNQDGPGDEIPGDKPTPDEPTPDEPTPDEPTPDEPTPDEPTPEEPTLDEPTPVMPTVSSAVPQMGDNASIAQAMAAGAAGAGMIAAGLAGGKKRKKGEKDLDEDLFNSTFDDIESVAKQWSESDVGKVMHAKNQANAYDYDELEAIAEQWKNSKEREEWLQHREYKGKTR